MRPGDEWIAASIQDDLEKLACENGWKGGLWVAIYHSILVAGSAAKVFALTAPARVIARNLVALEDGHGYYVAVPGTEMDAATAERYILSYAEVATGCRLSPEDSAAAVQQAWDEQ